MAQNIDRVPFNQVPEQWAFDPQIGPFIRQILEILSQNRERSGGDNDIVDNNIERIINIENDIDNLQTYANFSFQNINSNYTTTGTRFLNVLNPDVVITMRNSPLNGELVTVYKNTGSNTDRIYVNVNGDQDIFLLDQIVLSYRYSSNLNKWIRGG